MTNTIIIEKAADALYRLAKQGHQPGECMNRLPTEFYDMSGEDMAAAFRRSGEMLNHEADELRRYVAQRQAARSAA